MKDQQGSNRISSGLIVAVSALVVAVSGGVAWLTSQSHNTPIPLNSSQTITKPTQPTITNPNNEQTPNVYWLKPEAKSVNLVPRPVKIATATLPQKTLEVAFQSLLSGPREGEDTTTIPKGTKLLGLSIKNDEVHVNLSADFTSGGGSTSMLGRVGQVIYTATTLNPQAKVYIDVDGKPLDVLGGEGVELEQPLTRASFKQNYQL